MEGMPDRPVRVGIQGPGEFSRASDDGEITSDLEDSIPSAS